MLNVSNIAFSTEYISDKYDKLGMFILYKAYSYKQNRKWRLYIFFVLNQAYINRDQKSEVS